MKPRYFISYSRVDSPFALRLVGDLKARGINAWFDQLDIPPGVNWDAEIEKALAEAHGVLLVLSANSAASDNVKNEISAALELKKQVVPIVLAKSSVPLMITRLQREDFTGDYDAAFDKLVLRLAGGRSVPTEAVAAELGSSFAQPDSLQPSVRPVATVTRPRPPLKLYLGAAAALLVVGVIVVKVMGGPDPGAGDPVAVAATAPDQVAAGGSPDPAPAQAAEPDPSAPQDQPTADSENPTTGNAPEGDDSAGLTGAWQSPDDGAATIVQNGNELTVTLGESSPVAGSVNGSTVNVKFDDSDSCCSGRVSADGDAIKWSDGATWRRKP